MFLCAKWQCNYFDRGLGLHYNLQVSLKAAKGSNKKTVPYQLSKDFLVGEKELPLLILRIRLIVQMRVSE